MIQVCLLLLSHMKVFSHIIILLTLLFILLSNGLYPSLKEFDVISTELVEMDSNNSEKEDSKDIKENKNYSEYLLWHTYLLTIPTSDVSYVHQYSFNYSFQFNKEVIKPPIF